MKLNFWANTDVGKVRGHNEDNFLVDKKLNLFVVCDGMGGHAAGEVASAVCVRSVREVLGSQTAIFENMKKDPGNPNFRKAVISVVQHAIQEACATIWNMAQADSSRKGMGTTCSLLLVIGNIGFIGHVGDSRIYLCRGNKIHQVTTDHSLVNEMLRLGKIKPGEEESVPHKNAVTRAVGVNEVVEVDSFEFEFTEGDSVLLCSDGLSGYLETGNQVLDLMADRDPREVTEDAIVLANEAGGKDNITAISIHFGESGFSTASEKQILKEVEFFRYLTPNELTLVFGICAFETFSKGHQLFAENEDPARLCVVIEGQVDLNANNKPLKTIQAGNAFAEFSVLNASPIRYSAKAIDNVRILSIGRDTFMELMKNEPSLTVKILWNFVQRYSQMSSVLTAEDLVFREVGLSDLDSSGSLSIDSESLSDPVPINSVEFRDADTPDIIETSIINGQLNGQHSVPPPQKGRSLSGKSVVKPSSEQVVHIDETIEIDIADASFEEI